MSIRGFKVPGATMADDHLTYIKASANRYDVYWRSRRGDQLGWVERWGNQWWGMDFDSGVEQHAPTRWEVATWLWPKDAE